MFEKRFYSSAGLTSFQTDTKKKEIFSLDSVSLVEVSIHRNLHFRLTPTTQGSNSVDRQRRLLVVCLGSSAAGKLSFCSKCFIYVRLVSIRFEIEDEQNGQTAENYRRWKFTGSRRWGKAAISQTANYRNSRAATCFVLFREIYLSRQIQFYLIKMHGQPRSSVLSADRPVHPPFDVAFFFSLK